MEKSLIEKVFAAIEARREELTHISSEIWSHPEVGYEEVFACDILCKELEANGFAVKKGVAGLDTAFLATKGNGKGPNIAFCAEYDALLTGHACGHNLFCVSAVGAAIEVSKALEGTDMTLSVIGCPSEESSIKGSSGKIFLIRGGVFDGIDMAMIGHADGYSVIRRTLVASANAKVIFTGKSAHAGGSPEKGVNALTAGTLAITNLNGLRQHFLPGMIVNPIIEEGGVMANTIPDRCVLKMSVRGMTGKDRDKLMGWIENSAKAAALVTGCSYEVIPPITVCDDLRPNDALCRAYQEAMDLMGLPYLYSDHRNYAWDMGSVSYICPSIAPYHKIGPDDLVGHTEQFRECAGAASGYQGMIEASKAMAYTACKFLLEPEFRKAVKEEFETYRG